MSDEIDKFDIDKLNQELLDGVEDYIDVSTFRFSNDYDEIKIKLSNNFNFKDVYNDETFIENFDIVKYENDRYSKDDIC